jgi:hypothetical protein
MYSDIFEVYKDFKDGIATFANTCDDYKALEEHYINECRKFVKAAKDLPYKKRDKDLYITFYVLVVVSTAIVALCKLSKLQIQLGSYLLHN